VGGKKLGVNYISYVGLPLVMRTTGGSRSPPADDLRSCKTNAMGTSPLRTQLQHIIYFAFTNMLVVLENR